MKGEKVQSAAEEGLAMTKRKRKLLGKRPIAGSAWKKVAAGMSGMESPPSVYDRAVALMEKQPLDGGDPDSYYNKQMERELRMQKEIDEQVKETRALYEQIKKDEEEEESNGKRRRKFADLDSDDDEIDDDFICITSYKNPDLMAKVMIDTVPPLRKPVELDTDDPNFIRIANIAIDKFNQEYESSYVLERVITGSRIFRGGYDYSMAFVAAHPYKSIKVTSLFYAHYMDLKEESFFKGLKLLKPFIELPEQGGNDVHDGGDNDDVGDAADGGDEEDGAVARPDDGGKEAAEAQSIQALP